MFYVRLKLRGGKGGSGIISWEKTKRNSRLGPAGGNGGNGASIFFVCSSKFSDFAHLKTQIIIGENGKNGERERKSGSSAKNITIEIPPQTQIYDLDERLWKNTLSIESGKYLICRGGRGGRGNASFKNAQFQAPWLYELGEQGEEKELLLVLKNYHQIGIISLPEECQLSEALSSRLKSSSKLSKLRCFVFSHSIFNKTETKQNFLREIELCKIFIFLLVGEKNDNLVKGGIESKLRELGFNSFLTLYCLKTQDFPADSKFYSGTKEEHDYIQRWIEDELKNLSYLPAFKAKNTNSQELEYIEYSDELFPDKERLNISKTKNGWEVRSARLNYWTKRVPQTTLHNLERLRQKIKISEINREIKKLGGLRGEKVKIYSYSTQVY